MLKYDEIREFERVGFLGPFDLPASVLNQWDKSKLPVIGSRIKRQHIQVQRNQHLYSKSLVDLVTTDVILERLKLLLGPDILLWVAHVVEREPGAGGQLWHVDRINQLTCSLHVSIALTDMTITNGCLRAVPGSHLYRLNLSEWKRLDGAEDASSLADVVSPWNAPHEVVDLEVKAGQFFFTWGGLWHAVGKNISNDSRFACVARFGRTDRCIKNYGSASQGIQGGRVPCILVSGEDRFGLNIIQSYPDDDFLTNDNYIPSGITRFVKQGGSQFLYQVRGLLSGRSRKETPNLPKGLDKRLVSNT